MPSPVPFAQNIFFGGSTWATWSETRAATSGTTRKRLEFALGWPTPTNRGTSLAPNGVEANLRAYGSDSARCTACTTVLDILVAPSTHTDSTLTPIASGCRTLGKVGCILKWFSRVGLYRPQVGVRTARCAWLCMFSCLFSAASEHTDDAVVMEQAYRGQIVVRGRAEY